MHCSSRDAVQYHLHCSSRDAQTCIAVAGILRCSRDIGIALLKGCRLRKLCAELISCFDLFAMPAKKHNKAAVSTTEVPKSNEAAKHVKRSLPQSSADAIQRKRCKGPSTTTEEAVLQVADEHASTSIPNAKMPRLQNQQFRTMQMMMNNERQGIAFPKT